MGLRRNLEQLNRRKWAVLACGAAVGVVVGGVSTLRTPTYSATARVLVTPGGSGVGVATQAQLIAIPRLAQKVASDLAVSNSTQLARAVKVRRVGTSDVIAITARSSSRDRTVAIANGFAAAAIDDRRADARRSLARTIATLDTALAAQKVRLTELDRQARAKPPVGGAADQLTAAAAHEELLQGRRRDLADAAASPRDDAVLIQPAVVADARSSRHPVRDAGFGALAGLVLGLGIALIRGVFDQRVRTSDELARVTGLPILAELPSDRASARDGTRVAVIASPRSSLSEAARALRAGIELRTNGQGRATMLITSADEGAGASLVAANLAAAYALAGHRTVLVDGDLRNPRLSAMFGTYPGPLLASGQAVHGLSSLVEELGCPAVDAAAVEHAALLRTPIENLLFLPAGPDSGHPADVLDSRAMAVLVADLRGIADVVIVDAPPLLTVSDAAGLARLMDAVVLVAAVGNARRGALRRCRTVLAAHPRVLGVVANQVASATTRGRVPVRAPDRAAIPLTVMRRREVPMPRVGSPDGPGDIWIDLSDEPDPVAVPSVSTLYGSRVGAGSAPTGHWAG